jgi:hypothetical protein
MAEINNIRELMHNCCEVNCEYMRLPAGDLANYQTLSALYQRIADQSLLCAGTWLRNHRCPDHEPAVDAFWWGVVSWAQAFGLSIGAEQDEWERVFVEPHIEFASYLKHGDYAEPLPIVGGPPADIILRLDALWMERVVKLTGRWGFLQHMKDMPALHEAQNLERELRAPDGDVRDAYLRSDLKFFQALFKPFPFKSETRQQLRDWLAMADPDNK